MSLGQLKQQMLALCYKMEHFTKGLEGQLLKFLGEEDAVQAMIEVHKGIFEAYQPNPKVRWVPLRQGLYWQKKIEDYTYVERCQECQRYGII